MTTIVLLIVALVFLWVMFAYNRLVRLRNQVRTAWADIDVQLTRRHDLVPQLVAAVKGYAGHEQAVMRAVSELRAQALTLRSPAQLGEVESALEQALGRLFALQKACTSGAFAISFLSAGAMIAFGGVQIAFLVAGIGLLGVIIAVSPRLRAFWPAPAQPAPSPA